MKKYRKTVLVAFVAIFATMMLYAFNSVKKETAEEEVTSETSAGPIKWMTFNEAMEANKKNPRKIFIDVYTDWCGWCKKMDATTFSNTDVATYVNKNYYPVKLNAEQRTPVVYKGQTFTQAELAGKVFGISGYPTTVYLDEKGEMLTSVSSYLDAPTFDKIIHYFGGDNHKTLSYQDFEKTYKPAK